MTCDNNCGTGGWVGSPTIPTAGEPDNFLILTATAVVAGIRLHWGYPTTNPQSATFVKIYRGNTNVFDNAIQLDEAGGGNYFDHISQDTPVTYYYWIRVVSLSGNIQDPIGPATATYKPLGVWTLESLTDKIDNGVLAQALKEKIAVIPLLDNKILKEIEDRLASNVGLSQAIAQAQNNVNQALIYVQNETTQRQDADSTFAQTINLLYTQYENSTAAINEEKTIRANADSAMASDILDLYVKTGENKAAYESEVTVRTNADSALSQRIDTLTAEGSNGALAAIEEERIARVNADGQLAQSIDTLSTNTGTNISAAVQAEATARTNADNSLAQQINTVQSQSGDNLAQAQLTLQTQINAQGGTIYNIGALITAKVGVNGLIGGFGIYNNGQEVEAGFDVDLFWVGRTQTNKVKPFIIYGDTVYIDKARIRDADIDTLKIAGNAVTIPISMGGSVSGNGPYSNYNSSTIAQVTAYYPESINISLVLAWNAVAYYDSEFDTQNPYVTLNIYMDGVSLITDAMYVVGSDRAAIVAQFNASAGSHIYTASINTSGGKMDSAGFSAVFIGSMR